MDARIEKLLKAAPPLREEDLTKINALYPAYLFRRRRTREIWTSCCGRKEKLSEYSGLMYEDHQPEITTKTRYYGGCGGFYPSSAPRVQEKVKKAEAAGASAEEAEALKEKVSALEKKLKTSDADMTRAKLLFSQLQEAYRKLGDAIDAISDAEAAEKVRAAVKTLLQNWLA